MIPRHVAEAFVAEWNRRVPPGSPCSLINHHVEVEVTRTVAEAWCTENGFVMVSVEGRDGDHTLARNVPLNRIVPHTAGGESS